MFLRCLIWCPALCPPQGNYRSQAKTLNTLYQPRGKQLFYPEKNCIIPPHTHTRRAQSIYNTLIKLKIKKYKSNIKITPSHGRKGAQFFPNIFFLEGGRQQSKLTKDGLGLPSGHDFPPERFSHQKQKKKLFLCYSSTTTLCLGCV